MKLIDFTIDDLVQDERGRIGVVCEIGQEYGELGARIRVRWLWHTEVKNVINELDRPLNHLTPHEAIQSFKGRRTWMANHALDKIHVERLY